MTSISAAFPVRVLNVQFAYAESFRVASAQHSSAMTPPANWSLVVESWALARTLTT
jgi:hypothetical protein